MKRFSFTHLAFSTLILFLSFFITACEKSTIPDDNEISVDAASESLLVPDGEFMPDGQPYTCDCEYQIISINRAVESGVSTEFFLFTENDLLDNGCVRGDCIYFGAAEDGCIWDDDVFVDECTEMISSPYGTSSTSTWYSFNCTIPAFDEFDIALEANWYDESDCEPTNVTGTDNTTITMRLRCTDVNPDPITISCPGLTWLGQPFTIDIQHPDDFESQLIKLGTDLSNNTTCGCQPFAH